VHTASRGTYGPRRITAELVLGRGISVGHGQLELLMTRAGLAGLPGRRRWRHAKPDAYAADLVNRAFARDRPGSPERAVGHRHHGTPHPGREVYCAVVLDTNSRRVVGWSTDASPTAALVTNALGMAITNPGITPAGSPETVIHSDQGVPFGSWAFTQRAKDSGLIPSMGSVGDCNDIGLVESFWSRMQVELLNRRRWTTRIALANAIFEYLEIFHKPAEATLRARLPDANRARTRQPPWRRNPDHRTPPNPVQASRLPRLIA
jgi:transposase InsO family protein